MYESPINIIESAVTELQEQQEEGVIRLIRRYGITVDKEELLKALANDRDQYNKGYAEGVRDFAEVLNRELDDYAILHADLAKEIIYKILTNWGVEL